MLSVCLWGSLSGVYWVFFNMRIFSVLDGAWDGSAFERVLFSLHGSWFDGGKLFISVVYY